MSKRLKAVAKFPDEASERAFWETKGSTGSIKTAANARDVPYQSLIKVWLQEKLQES
jgi:hypothetical protein